MNQAQGNRYKVRIQAASMGMFLLTSISAIYAYLQVANITAAEAGVATTTVTGSLSNVLVASLYVIPLVFLASWIIHSALKAAYLRDPGYALKEGCYSDVSWLNLNDNQLVLFDKTSILVAGFEEQHADKIFETFQNDSSCEDLKYVLSTQTIHRVQFENIEIIESDSTEAFVDIVSNKETTRFMFLNSGTKAHALAHLKNRLPTTMQAQESVDPAMKTILPQLIACAIFVAVALLAKNILAAFVLAAPIVFLIPGIIESVLNPVVYSKIRADGVVTVEQKVDEPAYRQAA